MNHDTAQLIHGYLDDSLSLEEQAQLGEWIKSDTAHAQAFVAEVMLHDRLRSLATSESLSSVQSTIQNHSQNQLFVQPVDARRWRIPVTLATSICLLLFIGLIIWQYSGSTSVSAAEVELNRLISVSSRLPDQTYVIAVEESILPAKEVEKFSDDRQRPPKPPLDGALLYVRGANQFVLQRKLRDNQLFVTGCNGKTSWAVQPKGPVRVSLDLTKFNHDVPGHEHSMPLNNLHDGLEQIRKAYELNVMPIEQLEQEEAAESEPNRLLVAVKKPGFRGPQRVEISYGATSGQIRQIRLMQMPYGPERLTVRMTWLEEREFPANFFDHAAHHDSQQIVEFEE